MPTLTAHESDIFFKEVEQKIVNDTDFNVIFLKALPHLLMNASKMNIDFNNINENTFKDDKKVRELLTQINTEWMKLASSGSPAPHIVKYTTGQLATFFGVTITTINNWISEGRFIGFQRNEANKQSRIPADTIFLNRAGKEIPVGKVVELYEREQRELLALDENDLDLDEVEFLISQCARYESKYGAEYHKTLALKTEAEMTLEERTDAPAWKYFSERLNLANRED